MHNCSWRVQSKGSLAANASKKRQQNPPKPAAKVLRRPPEAKASKAHSYQRNPSISLQRPSSNSPSLPLPYHPETLNVSLLLSSRRPAAAIATAAHRVPHTVHNVRGRD